MYKEIHSLTEPGVQVFASLTEAQLRNRLDSSQGLFIAESPKVIRVALDQGYEAVSLLCERRHIEGDAADIISSLGSDVPVYTGDRELLAQLTGYTLTRGVLCAMRRPVLPSLEEFFADLKSPAIGRRIANTRQQPGIQQAIKQRIVIIDGVSDTTNIGAIFRSAAALGIDGVLLTRTSCDPLNRRAVRVSMGSVFLVPWTWLDPIGDNASERSDDPTAALHAFGFRTAAMALTPDSVTLDDPVLMAEPRLAIIMGTEGDGLPRETIHKADYVVRIPMSHHVDSLNVAAAAAVAFWALR